jgi:inner membrane transporter RhtA
MNSGGQVGLSLLALAGAMFSVQAGSSFAKLLFPEVGAVGASGLRVFLSSLILLLIHRPWRQPLRREQLLWCCAYGLTLGTMNTCFYQAIARIPLGLTVGIEFLGPLTVALAASRRRLDVFWALLAALGFTGFLPLSDLSPAVDLVGVGFALGAAVAWGCYIMAGQAAARVFKGGGVLAWGMCFANLVSLPPALWSQGSALFRLDILPLAVGVAIFSSALPYTLEMVALRRLPPQTFGTLMSVEPGVASLVGYIILGERLSLVQGCGLVAVMAASFGASWTSRRN